MPELSIVILSYNTKSITQNCLSALLASLEKFSKSSEIIIIDNGSIDGSTEMINDFSRSRSSNKINIININNKLNKGFSAANNQAIKLLKGKYVLFLNSDTIIKNIKWDTVLNFLNKNNNIGVLTVKILLPTGQIDPASHRGFPTLWNSFCYFSGLEKLLGRIPFIGNLFSGYHLLGLNFNIGHEIDSPSGTFYLTKKTILNKINGFDSENFFMYGEDIDLSFRIKKLGYEIYYYPYFSVLHIKSVSGLKKNNIEIKKKTRKYFYTAMKAFYMKHYSQKYPNLINKVVCFLIDLRLKENEKNRN